jgi:hypothetical protein
MSEFQRIAFRAIDGPVSEKNLEFMERQSTRAEITAWTFDNEYQWGNFRGDALEMLRRGYDLHVHYANFGIRTVLIRLPYGLPDPKAAEPYFGDDTLQFHKDKQGPGGTLAIEPCFDAGELEELWDIDEFIGRLIPLRAEILDGDLRPLYLAHLAMCSDQNHDPEESTEAPVPAGLEKPSDAQRALAEYCGLGDFIIAAAAEESPRRAAQTDVGKQYADWLENQSEANKNAWLAQWLAEPSAGLRREILAKFNNDRCAPSWATSRPGRSIAALMARADEIADESSRKAADKAARDRVKHLAKMAADPDRTLRETEELIQRRTTEAYRKAATQLADLRDALAGSDKSGLAETQAQKLKSQNPTLHRLTSELRTKGLLPK